MKRTAGETTEYETNDYGLKKPKGDGMPVERPLGFTEFRFLIDKKHQGLLIGKAGTKISMVRQESGVFASILKIADPTPSERILVLQGTVEQCALAWKLFGDVIAEFQMEQERKNNTESAAGGTVTIKVLCDQTQIGSVIGKGGVTIKQTQIDTTAKIQCSNDVLFGSSEKTINISATTDVLQNALLVILGQLRDYPLRPGTNNIPFVPGSRPAAAPVAPSPYAQNPYNPYAAEPPAQYGAPQAYAGAPAYYPPAHHVPAPSHHSADGRHSQKIVIPTVCAGGVIGKGGARIKEIQAQSGCTVRLADATPEMPAERVVTLEGSNEGIQIAIQLIRHAVEACPPAMTHHA